MTVTSFHKPSSRESLKPTDWVKPWFGLHCVNNKWPFESNQWGSTHHNEKISVYNIYSTLINVVVLDLLTSTGKFNCQLYVEAWCLIIKFCYATYWHFHSKMLVTVPKWYICLKKNTNIYKKSRNTKRFLKISMIKNLTLLTYNKSFWLRHDDLSYNCSLRYYSNRIVAIEKKKKKQPKKKTRYSTKQSLLYLLIWSPYNLQTYLNRKLFRVTFSGD